MCSGAGSARYDREFWRAWWDAEKAHAEYRHAIDETDAEAAWMRFEAAGVRMVEALKAKLAPQSPQEPWWTRFQLWAGLISRGGG